MNDAEIVLPIDCTAFGGSLSVLWMLMISVEQDQAKARLPRAWNILKARFEGSDPEIPKSVVSVATPVLDSCQHDRARAIQLYKYEQMAPMALIHLRRYGIHT